jgi:hypothetical protein
MNTETTNTARVLTLRGEKRLAVYGTRIGKTDRREYLLDDKGPTKRVPRARVDADGRVWSFKPDGFELEGEYLVGRVTVTALADELDNELKHVTQALTEVSKTVSQTQMLFLRQPDGKCEIASVYVSLGRDGKPGATISLRGLKIASVDAEGVFHANEVTA